jgi:hypothetical protein
MVNGRSNCLHPAQCPQQIFYLHLAENNVQKPRSRAGHKTPGNVNENLTTKDKTNPCSKIFCFVLMHNKTKFTFLHSYRISKCVEIRSNLKFTLQMLSPVPGKAI